MSLSPMALVIGVIASTICLTRTGCPPYPDRLTTGRIPKEMGTMGVQKAANSLLLPAQTRPFLENLR
jgi:hypothetical protein